MTTKQEYKNYEKHKEVCRKRAANERAELKSLREKVKLLEGEKPNE